jgi:hypothetical protein
MRSVTVRDVLGLFAILAGLAVASWFLLVRPVDPMPNSPDLLARATPVSQEDTESVYRPEPASLAILVDRGETPPRVSINHHPPASPAFSAQFSARLEAGRTLRLFRKKADARQEIELWSTVLPPTPPPAKDAAARVAALQEQILYFSFLLSPDGKWALTSPHQSEKMPQPSHTVVLEAFRLDGSGKRRSWEVSFGNEEWMDRCWWLPDSTGWVTWRRHPVRSKYKVSESDSPFNRTQPVVLPLSDLLEARLNSPKVRTLLSVTGVDAYPPIVGTLDDGLTLAVEGSSASPGQSIKAQSFGAAVKISCEVILNDNSPEAEREGVAQRLVRLIRVQSKSAGGLHLVAFPGADAAKVNRQFRVPLPPNLTSAMLHLSPDGRHLALWCHSAAIEEPVPAWKQDLFKKPRPRLLRRGAHWLVIADLETGKQTLVGSHPEGTLERASVGWIGWTRDGKSVLVSRRVRDLDANGNQVADQGRRDFYVIPVL